MQALKDKILEKGLVIGEDILKVDSFLNHQMDIDLINQIGQEFYRRFESQKITKILTIEASGIGIAALTALYFKVPMVFAKKMSSKNLSEDTYQTEVYSFTKDQYYTVKVSKQYLSPEDRVLIIDDFLANGHAAIGLMDICKQAGATPQGIGIVIEKGFQEGGDRLRKTGVQVESLAIVDRFKNGKISFLDK